MVVKTAGMRGGPTCVTRPGGAERAADGIDHRRPGAVDHELAEVEVRISKMVSGRRTVTVPLALLVAGTGAARPPRTAAMQRRQLGERGTGRS